jgi:uncharacterized Zn-finger protein
MPEHDATDQPPTRMGELLPSLLDRLAARTASPLYPRWAEQVKRTGGCANPVHLIGRALAVDTSTGEIVASYCTSDEPDGRLMIACGDRREVACPACSALYRLDAFHLVRAGLAGGKGVPETVASHPRVFATLTAPSFGPVHSRREPPGRTLACRPNRSAAACPAGGTHRCTTRHAEGDELLGTPICPACYDYLGAVLWQSHAGRLWRRFTIGLWRELARTVGVPRNQLRDQLRLSYVKVAEFQRRGLVHFHTVIRLDGPDGPSALPPAWVTTDLLASAVRAAARATRMRTPLSRLGERTVRFGGQLDVQPLDDETDGRRIAGYIAKYTTKATESTGANVGRLASVHEVAALNVSEHIRALIRTAWYLGGLREFEHLNLRRWAHMLAYPGHFTTKSRQYSITFTSLRAARADHTRAGRPVLVGTWRYAGRGHSPADALLAAGIAGQLTQNRQLGREAA